MFLKSEKNLKMHILEHCFPVSCWNCQMSVVSLTRLKSRVPKSYSFNADATSVSYRARENDVKMAAMHAANGGVRSNGREYAPVRSRHLLLLVHTVSIIPSVLWRCWLVGRKGIRPVKNWVVGCWRGYLSGARCRLAYDPADATATHCLLLQ